MEPIIINTLREKEGKFRYGNNPKGIKFLIFIIALFIESYKKHEP